MTKDNFTLSHCVVDNETGLHVYRKSIFNSVSLFARQLHSKSLPVAKINI